MGLVIVHGFASLYALNVAMKRRITLAAYVTLGTVLVCFPLSTLFWSGATLVYTLGILIFVNALAQLILLREERLWAFALSLITAALPAFFDSIPLPWQRFDVTQWVFTSVVVFTLLGSSIALAVWRLVIAYQTIKKLGLRLGVTLVTGGLLVAMIMGLASTVFGIITSQNQILDQLAIVADLKEDVVHTWLSGMQLDFEALFVESYEMDRARSLLDGSLTREDRLDAETTLGQRFRGIIARTERYDEIFLVNPDGEVVLSSNTENMGKSYAEESFFINGLLRNYVDQPRYVREFDQMSVVVTRPVVDFRNQVLGVVAARINMGQLDSIVSGGGTGKTGVTYLVAENYALLTSLRENAIGSGVTSYGINKAVKRARSSDIYTDYRGVTVLGVYRWLPDIHAALITEVDRNEILRNSLPTIMVNSGVSIATTILGVLLALWISRGITKRLSEFATTATRIAEGEVGLAVQITQDDEISELARAFNSMTAQLKTLVIELEQRVEDRTRGLLAVAEVSRTTTSELDPERLMQQVVNMVYEQFQLYYVGLFLVEETEEGRFAVLHAGTGESGRQMLAQGWRLPAGGESMIGQCISTGLLRVKQTELDIIPRFENAYLPDTQSELALPLRYGPRVIGAMTVQSDDDAAFDETFITLFQNMADQVAVAIENARLFAETQAALERSRLIQQRYQGQAWREYLLGQAIQGYEQHEGNLTPLGRELLPEVKLALASGGTLAEDGTLIVPIIQSGQVVGVLGFESIDGSSGWSEEQITLLQGLAEQLALTAENQRLLDESQRRAAREQLTREITAQLRQRLDVNLVAQQAAHALSEALDAGAVTVRLGTAEQLRTMEHREEES